MSINPFFLDKEFNYLLERRSGGKRGKGHADVRKLTAPAPPSVKQGEEAPVKGGGNLPSTDNPQTSEPASKARMDVLTGLTHLLTNKKAHDRAVAKAAGPKKATRKDLADAGFSFPHGVPAPKGAKRHGEEDSPSKKLYLSGKGGRTGSAHTAAGPTDEGPHVNVVKFGPDKSVSVTHADVPQTEPDVPSLSSTSRTTGGQMGRTGVETHGVGNPGHEALVRRQEREAERVAAGKEPGTGHVQRVPHLVTSGGGSTGQLSIRRDPTGDVSFIGRRRTGVGIGSHRVGRETRSETDKLKPNSGGDNPSDRLLKIAAAKAKVERKAAREGAGTPAPEKKVVSGADLEALRAKHGYKP